MIGELAESGFLKPRQLDNGGTVMDITQLGRKALRKPTRLEALARARPSHITLPPPGGQKRELQPLFDLLSNWRLEQARQQGVPPFQILHLRVMHRIAARKPRTEEALLAIKGIGPRKLEVHGEEILGIIQTYLSDRPVAAQGRTH